MFIRLSQYKDKKLPWWKAKYEDWYCSFYSVWATKESAIDGLLKEIQIRVEKLNETLLNPMIKILDA